jgi:hypothetical protein
VESPDIRIIKFAVDDNAAKAPATALRVDHLQVRNPSVSFRGYKRDTLSYLHIPAGGNGNIEASGIVTGESGLQVGRMTVKASKATFVRTGSPVMGVENGSIDLDVSNVSFAANNGKPEWSVLVNQLLLQNPNNMVFGKKKSQLITERLSLGNLALSSNSVTDMSKLMRFNVSAWLETATGQLVDSTTTLQWYNAAYNAGTKVLSLDSFNYHPTRSLDSVMATTPYQTDYITFRSGAIRLTDFNLQQYKKDSSIIGNVLQVTNPLITVYRDKAPPVRTGKEKPLPVDLIKSIPLPVSLRQVQLIDGQLRYTERHARSRAEGTITLTRMKASLRNITNAGTGANDSLELQMTAWLMDSAELQLAVRESYTDTLSGFLVTLRMKPTSLSFLNPVLAPLSNVVLRSGTIDSLHLRAIGNKEVAVGAMNMFYHDLRIQLVKKGNATKQGIMGNFATFLANTFVIKKNNDGRAGFVYYERDNTRSFFNYLIRTTFSGMAASVGVKKNSKYRKKYAKLIRERGLPQLPFE